MARHSTYPHSRRKPGSTRQPARLADPWIPAFATEQVRGLKAHGNAVIYVGGYLHRWAPLREAGGGPSPKGTVRRQPPPKLRSPPRLAVPGQRRVNFRPCDEMSQHVVTRSTQATVFAQFSSGASRRAQPSRDRELANRIGL